MRPLTAAEAADLARVVTHPLVAAVTQPSVPGGRWGVTIRPPDIHPIHAAIYRRTLRACLRAAVRWMEEQR